MSGACSARPLSLPKVAAMNTAVASSSNTQAPAASRSEKHLFGPVIDFMGLGGASLIALFALMIFFDPHSAAPQVAFWFMVISNVINHPHFAHSYQIFYRDFGRKIGPQTDSILRYRYWFAGIIAPIAIIAFYAVVLMLGDVSLIGYSINVMFFLVGWHYVKQGYGMLSVDAVLKKRFFTDSEKKLLLQNAYAGWAFSYVYANQVLHDRSMFGISDYAFNIPEPIFWLTFIPMLGFGIATMRMFGRRIQSGKGVPVSGVMAYLTSIYIWQIAIRFNPLFMFVIPAFHSLQYMMVTTRFQLNVETEKVSAGKTSLLAGLMKNAPVAGLIQFYVVGATLGALAFWLLPALVTAFTDFQSSGFPAMWAFAVFWIFVNVHHYLLDNVMWRKGNPDVAKHLFSHD